MISRINNLALIALSLVFLPLSTLILCVTLILGRLRPRTSDANTAAGTGQSPAPRRRTILVTGVGMAKGLVLARLFHRAGHRVIGADFSPRACGARSRALDAFYVLRRPGPGGAGGYLDSVLKAIERERAELWVSCSGVASAMEDGLAKEVVEARTGCKAVQFDGERTSVLHDKGAFMQYTRDIVGLRVPESHTVTSGREMMEVLRRLNEKGEKGLEKGQQTRQFIAKSVGLNDKSRGDMTVLPLETAEKTGLFVSRLEALGISDTEPWLLQEFITGREYCTHSLVVRGEVRAFTACASTELLMHYEALRDDSPLTQAMLEFTRAMAHSFGEDFTGHLSFDFIVREPDAGATAPEQVELYPIECNPRAHTAVVLFADTPALVKEYLAVLDDDRAEGATGRFSEVAIPERPRRYYWIGHDLVTLLLLPTLQLVLLQISPFEYVRNVWGFLDHLLFWRDGTWDPLDPLPWWLLYHVYWPLQFWDSFVIGPSWSRINVSTTKMFECE